VFEIGSTLRETRVRRKTTLQQAEDDTKIRVKYIQAMENDDFDLMPSPAYVKGFLRTYSEYLGLDPDVMLDEYRSRFEPNEEHEPFGGNSALGRPHAHRRRNTVAFIAVVCLLILAVLYVIGRGNSPNKPTTPPPVTVVTPPASSSPIPQHTATQTPTSRFAVRILADQGTCWVQVRKTGISGQVIYEATMVPGTSHTFHTSRPLYLRLGVPTYVSIAVDGKTAFRPVETAANNYEVTRKGVVRL